MENDLPDIQCTEPNIKIPIEQVGVQSVEVPFKLESKYGGYHQLNANVSIRVFLDAYTKGISMSRLLLTLRPYLDLPLKHKLIKLILEDINTNIGSTNSYMKFEFRLPITRKSIKSNNSFPLYYRCRFEGQRSQEKVLGAEVDSFKFYQGIQIQYASYCPCSAELCNHLGKNNSFGFPHNQRSFANILIEVKEPNIIWLEDIIELVEAQIKTLPYPIIKRVDEQEIARVAGENPLFVEDAIRLISSALNENKQIHDWIVKCTHEESIHTSEAIAINYKGIPNGFRGEQFL
jgi:GTP cyclohydrolase IB